MFASYINSIIFNTTFNISFGYLYPETTVHSKCDKFTVKIKNFPLKTLGSKKIIYIKFEHKFFTTGKRAARIRARINSKFVAIALDYQKNISLPNIPTFIIEETLYVFFQHSYFVFSRICYFLLTPNFWVNKVSTKFRLFCISSFLTTSSP